MFYSIQGLCPAADALVGGYGFGIRLWPSFKQAVALVNHTQEEIDRMVGRLGRRWLDACGYDRIFDPDNCGHLADPKLPPGPNARPLYEPNNALRVSWGEWGPEHITVPGSACGLDLDRSGGCGAPKGGVMLSPHNVDNWQQVQLLLVVFTYIADHLALEVMVKERT